MTNYGILQSCPHLCVSIEDFDPLHGHKQIDFSSGGSFSVRALCRSKSTETEVTS